MRGIIVLAVIAIAVGTAMRSFGLDAEDIYDAAKARLSRARDDSKALLSGEYTERVARQLRAEAASSAAPAQEQDELRRELSAERRRMLEERAHALERQAGQLLSGNTESLKRQVAEQARQAGGRY